MKKYLVQFYVETDDSIGGLVPRYIPEEGVIAECSNKDLTTLLGMWFEKKPGCPMAIISEIREIKDVKSSLVRFHSLVVNKEFDGSKVKGSWTVIPTEMFEMRDRMKEKKIALEGIVELLISSAEDTGAASASLTQWFPDGWQVKIEVRKMNVELGEDEDETDD